MQWWEQRTGSGVRWGPVHWTVAVLAASILFVPLWRDREDAYFVIEPQHLHTLHAAAAGRVNAVLVQGGQRVHRGEPLLQMTSIAVASLRSSAEARTGSARFAAYDAEVRGQSVGAAAAEQSAADRLTRLADEAQEKLEVDAPQDGVVLTETPGLLLDQDVGAGQDLLDIADEGSRMVRVYIPSSALNRIPADAEVALLLPGNFSPVRLTLAQPDGDPVTLPAGLVASQEYKGVQLATFYCSRMELPAAGENPMFGASGEAKIFGKRRSLAGRFLIEAENLVRAHVW